MKTEDLLLIGVGYLLLKSREIPLYGFDVPVSYESGLAEQRIGIVYPVPVQTDSGLIIGGLGGSESAPSTNTTAPIVLDPRTGQPIARDPYGAIQTGGGIVVDEGGNVRFASGGYIRTDSQGNIIPASNLPAEQVRAMAGLPEGKRLFNEVVTPYLTLQQSNEAQSRARQQGEAQVRAEESAPEAPQIQLPGIPESLLEAAATGAAVAITPTPLKPLVPVFNLVKRFF